MILHIFDFSYGYAWYVEMYLCVFVLIPFLNILFDTLDQKGRRILIAVMALITLLPPFVSNFLATGVWLETVPDFLENMYVITYYFVGAYIARHQPKVNRWLCVGVALAVVGAQTGVTYLLHSWKYVWHICSEFSDLTHMVVALCIFLFFYQMDIKNKLLVTLIREISVCSFEMYLISYFADHALYAVLPIPAWAVLFVDFALCYLLARALRMLTVPLGQLLRKGAEKLIVKKEYRK